MSPEILKKGSYDFRTDIWSLGVTLYYVAYHKYPFIEDTIPALFKAIQMKELLIPKVAIYSNKVGEFIK